MSRIWWPRPHGKALNTYSKHIRPATEAAGEVVQNCSEPAD